jgi:predicted  nucleic acid-binding Zn-ribbon protein
MNDMNFIPYVFAAISSCVATFTAVRLARKDFESTIRNDEKRTAETDKRLAILEEINKNGNVSTERRFMDIENRLQTGDKEFRDIENDYRMTLNVMNAVKDEVNDLGNRVTRMEDRFSTIVDIITEIKQQRDKQHYEIIHYQQLQSEAITAIQAQLQASLSMGGISKRRKAPEPK